MPRYDRLCTVCSHLWEQICPVSDLDLPALCPKCDSPGKVIITSAPMTMRAFGGYDRDLGYVRNRRERSMLLKEKGLIEATAEDVPALEREAKRNKEAKMDRELAKYDRAFDRAADASPALDESFVQAFQKEAEAL